MSPKSDNPLVVAFVLTWNDTEMTERCVASLLASDYEPKKILLVDNGSIKPCGRRVCERFPNVELIELPENRGFTGGSNAGLSRALELGADFVQLVGNDSTLDPHAMGALVRGLQANPRAGMASPLLLDPGPERRVNFYTAHIDRGAALHHNHAIDRPLDSQEWPDVEVEFAPFVAPMFPRWSLEKIGLLDERFGTCWEDYDWCVRLLDAGGRVITVGDAICEHLASKTTGRTSPYIIYYTTRNRLICLARHTRVGTILRRLPYLIRSFWWQIRRNGLGNWASHGAFLRGWIDFVLGRRGGGWAARASARKLRETRG